MKKQFADYTLLHNHRRHGSLWLGPDHLLVIEKAAFFFTLSETYRRLDYDSIQGIFTARTGTGKAATILTSIALAVCLLITIFSFEEVRPVAVVFGVLTITLGIGLAIHLARGPTAGLVVRTEVRAWRLAAVDRAAVAGKVGDALIARCSEVQGGMLEHPPAPERAADPMTIGGTPVLGSAVPGPGAAAAIPMPPELPASHQKIEEYLVPPHRTVFLGFAALAVFGLLVAGELAISSILYTCGMLAAGIVAVIGLFAGISRRGGTASTGSRANWLVAVISLFVVGTSGYAISMMGVIFNSSASVSPMMPMLRALANFPSERNGDGIRLYFLVLAVLCVATGIIGLMIASRRKRQLAESEAVPAAGESPTT